MCHVQVHVACINMVRLRNKGIAQLLAGDGRTIQLVDTVATRAFITAPFTGKEKPASLSSELSFVQSPRPTAVQTFVTFEKEREKLCFS